MLITFGPLSTTDLKILLMLRCLSEPLRGDPAYSPDGLCRLLEECPLFFVHQDIYYLVREVFLFFSSVFSVSFYLKVNFICSTNILLAV